MRVSGQLSILGLSGKYEHGTMESGEGTLRTPKPGDAIMTPADLQTWIGWDGIFRAKLDATDFSAAHVVARFDRGTLLVEGDPADIANRLEDLAAMIRGAVIK